MIEKIREDIFEALLSAAVIENSLEELETYPDKREIRKTDISAQCDKKARRLLWGFYYREQAGKAWRIARRGVAAAVIAVSLAFGALYLHSEEIQAAVRKAVIEIFDSFIEMKSDYKGKTEENGRLWEPGYLPEGYEKDSEQGAGSLIKKVYKNQEGREIKIYIMNGAYDMQTDREGYEVLECKIHGYDGYLLMTETKEPEALNKIVWRTEETGFHILAGLDQKELIKIAESLK